MGVRSRGDITRFQGAAGGMATSRKRRLIFLFSLADYGLDRPGTRLPPLPLIAKTSWIVGTARGDIRIVPTLMEAKVGTKMLRLGFDLVITPVATAPGS